MMWLLVIASCIGTQGAPECGSGISPVSYLSFATCADAAVRYHDHMRAAAAAQGQTVLLLDTRCLVLSSGAPA